MKKIILFCILICLLVPFYKVNALGSCFDYGMAYEDLISGGCKCMSGYVWGKSFLGKPYCVSGDTYCSDKYGYGSQYDYLEDGCKCRNSYVWGSDIFGDRKCILGDTSCQNDYGYGSTYDSVTSKCKCRYGYIFGSDTSGNIKCVDTNQYCHDKLGYSSNYNSLTDACECNSGYELSLKIIGTGYECKSCISKYGYRSSYNFLLKKCECDSGYTLDNDNQCIKKQNNVYFLLKELDDSNDKAIITSDFDSKDYLVSYGVGCLGIYRYLGKKLVVNLGTDFSVDTWDKIVLQDDNSNCDITSVEEVDSNYSLKPKQTDQIFYSSPQDLSVGNKVIISTNIDKNLTNRLKGKILLQVESMGEAWYINPATGKRHYMADGNAAYSIMRDLGIGITNKNLDRIKTNKNFAKKNCGKIFLQVEANGEAYYIDFNGNSHYLKDGSAAYAVMRNLGLGITNNDLRKIDIN